MDVLVCLFVHMWVEIGVMCVGVAYGRYEYWWCFSNMADMATPTRVIRIQRGGALSCSWTGDSVWYIFVGVSLIAIRGGACFPLSHIIMLAHITVQSVCFTMQTFSQFRWFTKNCSLKIVQ